MRDEVVVGKNRLGARTEINDFCEIADLGLPPDQSWYLLPKDFTPDQWRALTPDEQFFSVEQDRQRLMRQVEHLQHKVTEYKIVVFAAVAGIVGLIAARLF